jgi:nucleoside-diphosphate-sugar epimerase
MKGNSMQIKNIMVTGGGGFLGKAIVKKLLKKNYNVTSFSRKFYPDLEKIGVKQIQGDLIDKNAVEKSFFNMHAVFHVAAKPGMWGAFEKFYKVNVTGTKNVISACFTNKVGQLIHTSSPSVVFDEYDKENIDETTPYSKNYMASYPETKAMGEKLVRKACKEGLNTIILRPHMIWGPEDNHIIPGILARAHKLKKIGKKNILVDTIYIDNAADAHILALEKLFKNPLLSGKIYFISQDKPVNIWDMINDILDAAGKPPIKGEVSERTAYAAGSIFEFFYKLFNIKKDPPMTRFVAVELATSHWFNISMAKKDLGYYPKISTKEGLKRLKQWFLTMEQKKDE